MSHESLGLVSPESIGTTKQGLPRLVEAFVAAVALAVFFPLIAFAALLIVATSGRPVLFRQKRVGRQGCAFTLFKLRTMTKQNQGPQITACGDVRVTRLGKLLRKTKIDELPELWNVLRGDMSLVGARPEVPQYVDLQNSEWCQVLRSRPGITDPVTMRLRNEESLLATVNNPEEFYLKVLQPYKLKGYVQYLNKRTWWKDVTILFKTSVAVVFPGKAVAPTLEQILTCVKGPDAPVHERTAHNRRKGSNILPSGLRGSPEREPVLPS